MISLKRVSAIIPTYNCAAYLVEAIESILAQTYQDVEIIVIDDGSTDNTRQVLEPYQGRIVYLYQENRGESVARNRGIEVAKGEFIAFLDADDLWLPTKLERQVAAMDLYPEAVLAYSYAYAVDASGQQMCFRGSDLLCQGEAGLHQVFARLVTGNMIANPGTVLIRKRFLTEGTAFDSTIRWGEDWDLWLRLSLKGPFAFIPEPLACYRMHTAGRRLAIEASDEFVRQNEDILHKVFASLPVAQADWSDLRPLAFRSLYLRSAVYNFELGNVEQGARYMGMAVRADPDFAQDGRAFARRIADEGFRIAEDKGDLAEGETFIRRVFAHLPSATAHLQTCRARALSGFYTTAAFSQFAQGNRVATLRHIIRAIRYHPTSTQRGLLSIGAQALIGGKPWAKLRRRNHTTVTA